MMELELIKKIIMAVLSNINTYTFESYMEKPISIGVSNRHLHLSKEHLETLFGLGYRLKNHKELSQPGQYACAETVILVGPEGSIEQVRVLGPARSQTQVEILRSDCFHLGVNAPVRESGKLRESGGITIVGPKGTVQLNEGVIVAQRHIHMTTKDAAVYGVVDGQCVRLKVGKERGLVFDNVIVRVSDSFALEYHIDMDEANASGIQTGDQAFLLTPLCENLPVDKPAHNFIGDNPEQSEEKEPLRLITDETVREAWEKREKLKISSTTIITPLARDTIKELKVEMLGS